jgi:uncharacterized protein (TIGR04255 family)
VVTMPNAPVRYTLAMMRFPKVLNIEKFAGAFQEAIAPEYPLLVEGQNQGFEFTVGEGGAGMRSVSEKLWQFSDTGQTHAFILSADYLVLHAGRHYGGHGDFLGRFRKAVAALGRIEGLSAVVTALGYRYIDIVTPKASEGERLEQYLQPWVLPTGNLDLEDGSRLVDSAYVAGFQTPRGVLRLQALRRPPSTLPPELDSPFVRQNGWVEARPDGDFALLDLDHAGVLASASPADPDWVVEELTALRAPLREVFNKAVSDHARQVWNAT